MPPGRAYMPPRQFEGEIDMPPPRQFEGEIDMPPRQWSPLDYPEE
jgi:hypothetical protein